MKCQFCNRDVVQPFQCSYCGGYFCAEHRLPESHSCLKLPREPPFWYQKRRLAEEQGERAGGEIIERPIERTIPISYDRPQKRKSPRMVGFILIGLIVGVVIGSFSWHFLIASPNIQTLQQQTSELKTDLDIAKKERDDLEVNLRELQSEITKLEDERIRLKNEKIKIEEERDSLEGEISSLDREYKVLQMNYEDLEKLYEDLNRKYEKLFSDYDELERILANFFDVPLLEKEVPSISTVRSWLRSDRTNKFRYSDPDFVCGDFAIILAFHAREKHWDMGVIGIWGYIKETGEDFAHALNAIITEEGLVYVEPQSDEVWWYEGHEEIRKGKTHEIWPGETYETVDVHVEDVQIILSY